MKLRIKTVLLTLLAVGSMCLFTACGSDKTPYQINDEENYTVSVKFDANGGVFTTNTSVIVDSYNVSSMNADEDGYVTYPNVNTVTEMTNLIDASRSYEANVTAFNATKNMALKGLELGK